MSQYMAPMYCDISQYMAYRKLDGHVLLLNKLVLCASI